MRALRNFLAIVAVALFACALPAFGQDAPSPSVADVARQSRLQKQQKDAQAVKDAQSKGASTKDAATSQNAVSKDSAAKDASPKDATAKDAAAAKTPHVYTNDEIPQHVSPDVPGRAYQNQYGNYQQTYYGSGTAQPGLAEQWKIQIQSMKTAIANMQAQLNRVNESAHAGGNCLANCVQWNERQKQKQDQVELMKQQVEQMQKRLEDLQEAARRQGFGSSVYDP